MNKFERLLREFLPRVKLKSINELANRTGISKTSLCRKVKNPKTLTGRDLKIITEFLALSSAEIGELISSINT